MKGKRRRVSSLVQSIFTFPDKSFIHPAFACGLYVPISFVHPLHNCTKMWLQTESRTLSPEVQRQLWSPSAKNKHCQRVSHRMPSCSRHSEVPLQCWGRDLATGGCSSFFSQRITAALILPSICAGNSLATSAFSLSCFSYHPFMAPRHCTAHFSSSNIWLISKMPWISRSNSH